MSKFIKVNCKNCSKIFLKDKIYPKDLCPKIYLDNNLKNKFKDYMLL